MWVLYQDDCRTTGLDLLRFNWQITEKMGKLAHYRCNDLEKIRDTDQA